MNELSQELRLLEAMLFASTEPVAESVLASRLPEGTDVAALIADLQGHYAARGINLVNVAGKWALRTAPDLAGLLKIETTVPRKLSRAAVETLAIIAYHQPVTRAEVEDIRGVAVSRGTLDILLEAGWIRPRGRKRVPGRPIAWGTSDGFLEHFGLGAIGDLPGMEDLRAAGLLDSRQTYGAVADGARAADEGDEAIGPARSDSGVELDDIDPADMSETLPDADAAEGTCASASADVDDAAQPEPDGEDRLAASDIAADRLVTVSV